MFNGRVALDGIVAAVVIRQHQALLRDNLARAEAAKKYHGILHRGFVNAVNVLGGELEALRAHILHARRNKARQPHTLIGHGGQQHEGCKQGK